MARVMYKDMKMTSTDFWSLMIGFDVPAAFWSLKKFKSSVEENQYQVKNAEEEFIAMKNMITFEVKEAHLSIQTNYNLMQHFKNNAIPQAEGTLQSTLAEYQTGKTEFLMLIDAYRMVLMAKLDYVMAVKEYNERLAQLEQAVGINLTEMDSKIH
jgi:outer membrane protein TolC